MVCPSTGRRSNHLSAPWGEVGELGEPGEVVSGQREDSGLFGRFGANRHQLLLAWRRGWWRVKSTGLTVRCPVAV